MLDLPTTTFLCYHWRPFSVVAGFVEETTPIDKANMGTTPHVPAPHKDQSKTKSQTNASDVEQA